MPRAAVAESMRAACHRRVYRSFDLRASSRNPTHVQYTTKDQSRVVSRVVDRWGGFGRVGRDERELELVSLCPEAMWCVRGD